MRMEFDRGRLPFEIVLPFISPGSEVSYCAPFSPDNSASDMRGVGGWIGGKRNFEMSRALMARHEDDLPFHKRGKDLFIRNCFKAKI